MRIAAALLRIVLTTGALARLDDGQLGAGGSAAAQRIQRLIDPPSRDSRARRAVACIALATVATLTVATIVLAYVTIVRCPPAPYL